MIFGYGTIKNESCIQGRHPYQIQNSCSNCKFIVSPHAREVNKNFQKMEIVEHENSSGTPAKMTPTA